MVRPCFLVIDREYSGSISTRKLVIETAKLNVITAYSAREAIETLEVFPRLSGVVLDAGVQDIACAELVARIKQMRPNLPIVVIAAPGAVDCPQADHMMESFDPARLLALLTTFVPDQAAAIEERNEELSKSQT